MKILGIETSCDETSAAVVEDGKKLLAHVVASSAKLHQKYGGIVPEVAARKQVEVIIPVLNEALQQSTMKPFDSVQGKQTNNLTIEQFNNTIISSIEAIAVTIGPGLIGSLLVGVETAKTLSMVWNKPIIPVNHVLAHIYGVFLKNQINYSSSETSSSLPSASLRINNKAIKQYNNGHISFPAIALVVSGGHTEIYLMRDEKSLKWLGGTLDDAAGECFDKTARLLGLPYPGGPAISAAAADFELRTSNFKLSLPRPMINDNSLNFSFSGLKTAVLREYDKQQSRSQWNSESVKQFSYEIQEAITDVLVAKTLKAAEIYHTKSIIVSGGVAANKRLTEKFNNELRTSNFELFIPPPHLCADSASYIAAYAYFRGTPQPWHTIEAQPDLSVEIK